jgi:hypothetical protein
LGICVWLVYELTNSIWKLKQYKKYQFQLNKSIWSFDANR